MYPATIMNWYDQTGIDNEVTISAIDDSPLFMVVSSFDKGPEDLMVVSGQDFYNLFGNKIYFTKHGQNAIQAKKIIDAGGKLLIKRVCAKDSTLANLILTATLNTTETQKVNSAGIKIYLDGDGEETTTVTDNPVMVSTTAIKWSASSVQGCKTFEEVRAKALTLLDEGNKTYPVLVITDNGRGVSSKAVRIIPDYNTSKGIGKMFYSVTTYEGTTSLESAAGTLDPSVLYNNEAFGMDTDLCTQIKIQTIEEVYDLYVAAIAEALDSDVDTVKNYDLVYGYNAKGGAVSGLTLDKESVDLNTTYGIELAEGANGEFGDAPVNTEAWTDAIRAVYAGEATDAVYDVDQYKIAAIFDANLPQVVKNAIAEFVNFREDCMFFRDLGTGNNSFLEINDAYNKQTVHSRYIADFGTSYQVKDPVTKRNIEVTMMYDYAECMVAHISNGPFNPTAGVANGFILSDAIKGTVNFTPIITPSVNQKQAMDDIRVNYAIFEDDNCVVQTLYTSQTSYTQLSFINNVLAIQQVARALRTACPKNRYTLISGTDMTDYATAANNVLSNFVNNFDTLTFEFTQDSLKASQKIFYASIKFAFNNWAQTEIFDLFAVDNE